MSLKCLLKGGSIYTPIPLPEKKTLIITWFYMESRLSVDFDEYSSCQTLHLTKSRTFCWSLSYVTKPLSGQCCDRRWHMKGIPPHGFPRTMKHGLEVVCVCVYFYRYLCKDRFEPSTDRVRTFGESEDILGRSSLFRPTFNGLFEA